MRGPAQGAPDRALSRSVLLANSEAPVLWAQLGSSRSFGASREAVTEPQANFPDSAIPVARC